MVERRVLAAAERALPPIRRAVAAAAEPVDPQHPPRAFIDALGELNHDFAPLGIVVKNDVPVALAQAGRGRRDLLGGDSLARGNRLLGELMDEVEVHALHGFTHRIAEHVDPLVEQRHRHHVIAGNDCEPLLALHCQRRFHPVIADDRRGFIALVWILELHHGRAAREFIEGDVHSAPPFNACDDRREAEALRKGAPALPGRDRASRAAEHCRLRVRQPAPFPPRYDEL